MLTRRKAALGMAAAAIGLGLTLLVLEVVVRVHRVLAPNRVGGMAYHERLGWVPAPGRIEGDWTSNVDATGIRSNGQSAPKEGRPILVVGDSFAFGDEVEDGETWPAQLESRVGQPVLNAGVGAYGVDQAFLRAEMLLDTVNPQIVILSLIADDVIRTQYSYYPYGRGWKPYFEYQEGSLVLRNVPVPRGPAPPPTGNPRPYPGLRRALHHSLLADVIFQRIAWVWWNDVPTLQRVHRDGAKVSVELLARLDKLTRARGGRFVAVTLATNGRIGGSARLESLVKEARENGVTVLDLAADTLKLPSGELQARFQRGGHYTPAMNQTVASALAAFLRQAGTPAAIPQD